MYCNNCGYNNQNNTSFCNKCGRPLNTTMSVSNITLEEREKREKEKINEEKSKKINIIICYWYSFIKYCCLLNY